MSPETPKGVRVGQVNLLSRREFCRLGPLGVAAFIMSSSLFLPCLHSRSRLMNWAWLAESKESTLGDWERVFLLTKQHGVNGGLVLAKPETIRLLGPLARRIGIELHNWIITLRCTDDEVKKTHPEWFMVNREGVSCLEKPPYVADYTWLCPSRKEVQAYLESWVASLCALSGLAGIHLDYIRYPDVILPAGIQPEYNLVQDREFPEFDYCYCEVCRKLFQAKTGRDPFEIKAPSQDEAWVKFRYDSVSSLVNRLVEVAHKNKKILTAAVFPSPSIARKLVRQDWPSWNLDAFFPMMYHEYYLQGIDWIGLVTAEGKEALSGKAKLYSGLFVEWLPPQKLVQAVHLAIKNGASGVTLFMGTSMTPEQWKALKKALDEL